jgi:hypothetical protein
MKTGRRNSLAWAIVAIGLTLPASGRAQNIDGNQAPRLPTSREIHATNWKERRDAFEALIGLQETRATADRRRQLLFELLIVENEMVAAADARLLERVSAGLPPDEGLTEEYTEYYASVIAAVARLDDPRSARALAGAISTGWMAIGSLIAFGTVAVEPVAQRMTEANPSVRSTVTYVLSEMLARSDEIGSDAASRSIIKNVLTRAARDPEYRQKAFRCRTRSPRRSRVDRDCRKPRPQRPVRRHIAWACGDAPGTGSRRESTHVVAASALTAVHEKGRLKAAPTYDRSRLRRRPYG